MSGSGPAASPGPLAGTVLGRYLLVRLLGEGGMGAVYEATHQDLGRRVAIKILHPRYAESEKARSRFLREGQAASRIRHPNVADVYDVGIEGVHPYLVMELLEGADLAQVIEREAPLSVQRTADLLVPVVAAVAIAHDQGVVHRDLKPGNIFLSAERNAIKPKVLDFGVSKLIDHEDAPSLTDTGTFLGTPHYMSPEQAQGAKHVDVRSDQYSLGVILYECATARRPIEEDSMYPLLRRIVQGDFPSPRQINPNVSSAFENVILRAMARDPAQRFTTTRALGLALLDFASNGVRAAHAAELSSVPQSPEFIRDAAAANASIGLDTTRKSAALGTTESEAAVQRDVPRGAKRRWPWFGAGALLLASGVVGIVASRAANPNAAHPFPIAKASDTGIATAPLPADVPHSTATASPARKTLVSEPADASAWVGGIEMGRTPFAVDVPNTPLQVEFRFPGYESAKREISRSDPDEIRVVLTRRPVTKPPAGSPTPPLADRPQLAPR